MAAIRQNKSVRSRQFEGCFYYCGNYANDETYAIGMAYTARGLYTGFKPVSARKKARSADKTLWVSHRSYGTAASRPSYNSPRDPNIWWDEKKSRHVMFFCHRVRHGDMFTRGCVAAAESSDLVHWRLLPPVYGPGDHFYPESPHVVDLNGKYHMFFHLSPESGLRHAVAPTLLGPYEEVEKTDILPAYVGASEAIKVNGQWYFFARMLDRVEQCNRSRQAQRALCLPLDIAEKADGGIAFKALPSLSNFRGSLLFSTADDKLLDRWRVAFGDWRINTSPAMAANEHEVIPPNSLFGSSNRAAGRVVFETICRNLDMEFDFQAPSFNGNDCQTRGGFELDWVAIELDTFQKVIACHDPEGDMLAFKLLPFIKQDRYYHFRVFRCDGITQVYLDDELLMYLPAYGNGSRQAAFIVDHGDVIVKDIRIWELKAADHKGFTVDNPQGGTINGVVC